MCLLLCLCDCNTLFVCLYACLFCVFFVFICVCIASFFVYFLFFACIFTFFYIHYSILFRCLTPYIVLLCSVCICLCLLEAFTISYTCCVHYFLFVCFSLSLFFAGCLFADVIIIYAALYVCKYTCSMVKMWLFVCLCFDTFFYFFVSFNGP